MTDQTPADGPSAGPFDPETATAADLAALMAEGTVTAVDVTRVYLDRIAALNTHGPGLNAVRVLDPTAREQAAARDAERAAGTVRGPLHGVPVLIKDNIDLDGLPTTAGSIALEHSYPAGDAPLIAALRAAGAVVLGKVNLSEFAYYMAEGMPSGYSSLGGQVLNPYDVTITPSGSSSGSAVAVAAGMAPLAVGTETSGSILSPAAANSLAAVKPTVGLISRTGVLPISATQDTAGPMALTVRDAAALLTALVCADGEDAAAEAGRPWHGHDYTAGLTGSALAGARIGVVASGDPLFRAALGVLADRGATLVDVRVPEVEAADILRYEFARDLDAYLARLPDGAPVRSLAQVIEVNAGRPEVKFGQNLLVRSAELDRDDPVVRAYYEASLALGLAQARAAIDDPLTGHDLVAIASFSATTPMAARAGYPSVSVPAGYGSGDGRPGNLVFTGTAFSEQALLALAYDYEQATLLRRPPSVINPTLFRCVDPRATSRAP